MFRTESDLRITSRRARASRGFTLLEMLVTMSVLSLLTALTLPAVQHARESSRRLQCLNHLRQFALAETAFESQNGYFPSPLLENTSLTMSHHYWLLPFLDQQALFSRVDPQDNLSIEPEPISGAANSAMLQKHLPIFACPSDHAEPGATNYRVCVGTTPFYATSYDYPGMAEMDRALFGFGHRAQLHVSEITDGTSYTVMASERVLGDYNPAKYHPFRDFAYVPGTPIDLVDIIANCESLVSVNNPHYSSMGGTWLLGLMLFTEYNHVTLPNSPIPDCGNTGDATMAARSLHTGGVNIALVDGSARFASQSIDLAIWRALGSINGSEKGGGF